MKFFLSLLVLAGSPLFVLAPARAQEVVSSPHHMHGAAQPSTTILVSVGGKQVVLSPGTLQGLPQTSITVFNGHTKAEEVYSGPLVSDVLAKAGLLLSGATEHDVLHSYIVATGTDGYFVVFSGAELQGTLHKAQCIIALSKGGQPLTENGAFQLIDPLDVKPARWVRNLKALTAVQVAEGQ